MTRLVTIKTSGFPTHQTIWSWPMLLSKDLCSDWLDPTDLRLWLGDLWHRLARPEKLFCRLLFIHIPFKSGLTEYNYFVEPWPQFFTQKWCLRAAQECTEGAKYLKLVSIRKFIFQTTVSKCLIWATPLWDLEKLARCANTTKLDSVNSETDAKEDTTIKSVKIILNVKKRDALKDIQKCAETSKGQESVGTTTIVPTNTLFRKKNMMAKMKLN